MLQVEGSVLHPSQVLSSLILTLVVVCGEPEGGGPRALAAALKPLLHRDCAADWDCLDRRQVGIVPIAVLITFSEIHKFLYNYSCK
jgi:hypothetical protein